MVRFDEKPEKIELGDDDSIISLDSEDTTLDGWPKVKRNKVRNLMILAAKRQLNSAGVLCSDPSFIDNGDGTITVDEFEISIHDNSDFIGAKYRKTITGQTVSLPAGTSYTVVKWTGAEPALEVITDVGLINESNYLPVFTLYKFPDDTLLCLQWDCMGNGLTNKLHQRLVKTERFRREEGLSLSVPSGKIVSIGSGIVWTGGNSIDVAASQSDGADVITRLWYQDAGSWEYNEVTEFSDLYYNSGSGLAELSLNRYAVNWIFRVVSDNCKDINIILGTDNYKLNEAINAKVPELPEFMETHNILVGKIISETSSGTYEDIVSAFEQVFTGGVVNNHNNLSNLQGGAVGEYYHLSQSQYNNLGAAAEAAALGRRQSIAYAKIDKDINHINRDGSGSFSMPDFLSYNQAAAEVTLLASISAPFVSKIAKQNNDFIYSAISNQTPAAWSGLSANKRYFLGIEYDSATDSYNFITTETRPVYRLCKEDVEQAADPATADPDKFMLQSVVPISYTDSEGPEGFSFSCSAVADVFELYSDPADAFEVDEATLPVEITVNCPRSFKIGSYAIRAGATSIDEAPYAWTLEGSNDGGSTWDTLDNVSLGTGAWSLNEKKIFSIDTPGQYSKYKLTVNSVDGGSFLNFSAFDLFESLDYVFDISEMVMYQWTGSGFDVAKPTIFVGEIALGDDSGSGPELLKMLPYALQGYQVVDWFHVAPENNYVFDNFIGCIPYNIKVFYRKDLQSGEIREVKTYGMDDAYGAYQNAGCFTALMLYNFRIFTARYHVYDTTNSYGSQTDPTDTYENASLIEADKNYRSHAPADAVGDIDFYGIKIDRGW